MKRIALAGGLALALTLAALAANITPTPIVPPNETGENSLGSQQVTDMARLKLGMCTATTANAEAAMTATCNGASGIITTGVSLAIVSNAVPADKMTITNSKIQAGDMVMAILDSTGCAANSLPSVIAVQVAANTAVVQIDNDSATPCGAVAKVYFLVLTQGNPN